MKTTDHTSARINAPKSPTARWYRVLSVLTAVLALGAAAWLALGNFGLEGFVEAFTKHASPVLNVLAALSVAAVIAEGVRTSPGLRRKQARSLRVTQRLQPGSRTARA